MTNETDQDPISTVAPAKVNFNTLHHPDPCPTTSLPSLSSLPSPESLSTNTHTNTYRTTQVSLYVDPAGETYTGRLTLIPAFRTELSTDPNETEADAQAVISKFQELLSAPMPDPARATNLTESRQSFGPLSFFKAFLDAHKETIGAKSPGLSQVHDKTYTFALGVLNSKRNDTKPSAPYGLKKVWDDTGSTFEWDVGPVRLFNGPVPRWDHSGKMQASDTRTASEK